MKKSYTREKKTLCGEGYMEVDLYPITPEEHKAKRRKKTRPSSERQKKRNAQHSHRWRVQKANANFTVLGFYLTLTYIDTFLPESMEQAQRDLEDLDGRIGVLLREKDGLRIDRIRRDALLEEKGEALFAAWLRRLTEFDQGFQGLRHLRVLGHGREAGAHYPGIFALDPAKILISTQGTGLTGVALRDLLRREYRIEVEMALDRSLADNLHDWASVKARVREALSSYIYRRTKRSPMILPILLEV